MEPSLLLLELGKQRSDACLCIYSRQGELLSRLLYSEISDILPSGIKSWEIGLIEMWRSRTSAEDVLRPAVLRISCCRTSAPRTILRAGSPVTPKPREDLVQEACLRAFKFFDGFHGNDARAWLLTIVRNTCYTWLQNAKAENCRTDYNEEAYSSVAQKARPSTSGRVLRHADQELDQLRLGHAPRTCSLGDFRYRIDWTVCEFRKVDGFEQTENDFLIRKAPRSPTSQGTSSCRRYLGARRASCYLCVPLRNSNLPSAFRYPQLRTDIGEQKLALFIRRCLESRCHDSHLQHLIHLVILVAAFPR